MIQTSLLALVVTAFATGGSGSVAEHDPPTVTLNREDAQSILRILIDGHDALVYRYGLDLDLPHVYPVRSPTGRSMTVEHPDPFPHHRSFWFADRVKFQDGRVLDTYNAFYSKSKNGRGPAFHQRIRHVGFDQLDAANDHATVACRLVWEFAEDQPVLEEHRRMHIMALGDGEYFLDVTFTVTAAYGDVTFISDAVHYAWPYIRMNKTYSVEGGGRIVNSEGGVNQEGTNGKEAVWVDYSNTVEGATEGLAIFSHRDNAQPHRWLTRDYGCFGPRRVDARSGKPFTLKKGQSLSRRVGVLVHRGDVHSGRVAERYEAYLRGELMQDIPPSSRAPH